MSIAGVRDGSKGFMKRVTSTFSTKKNKITTNDPKPLLPRSKSTGSNYESMTRLPHGQGKKALPDVNTKRTKSAGVSPQPRRQKIDNSSRKQFTKLRCFDDSDSVWLSSDCASASSSLLGERRVSVSFHFSLDERVVSWLSNAAKNQEDTISTEERHQKSAKKAKFSSENNNNKHCPSESPDPELTLQEEKKVSFSLESEMSLEKDAEIGDSNKSKTFAEPLFWPYEQKFDWTPDDILKHFSISPRRKKSMGSKSAGTSPRSMRAQLQTRRMVLKEGCKRKLMFSGPGTSRKQARTIGNKKTKMSKNQQQQQPIMKSLKRNNSLPSSMLRNSREEVHVQAAEESVEMCKKTPKKLIMTRRSRTFIEDDFALMYEFSIENAVGLAEFRGREGIVDSDFNTDGFLFEDSL